MTAAELPTTVVDAATVPGTFAAAHHGVIVHSVPAVSIADRTVTIIRDPDEREGDPVAFYTSDVDTTDTDCGEVRWWSSAAHLRAHADELAYDLGRRLDTETMTGADTHGLALEEQLWNTVAEIAAQAAG